MKIDEIRNILRNKETLSLIDQEKRLILVALIRSDFNMRKAHPKNCPNDKPYTLNAYEKVVRKYFEGGVLVLKDKYLEYKKSLQS